MKVAFANLKRSTEQFREELDAASTRVLDSGWYVLGNEGKAFESEFASSLGVAHAVGVASGTDALELSLRALEIGPGDEVVTQANTCVPTVAAIERAGATPVLCDVDPDAGRMDAESLERAIGPRTRAVIPVHLYGQCADLDSICAVAGEIPVVEDCAQAHIAGCGGRVAGTVGRLGAFSFYPTKNLGALGDGGAVVTSDPELDQRLRLLRQYGQTDRYHHEESGVNSRLDELQAAFLRVKLPRLAEQNARRRSIAATYDDALAGTAVRPLARTPGGEHAYHLYVVVSAERDLLQQRLAESGVQTLIHYPRPIHRHPPYFSLATGRADLRNSDMLAEQILSVPLYPELSDDEVTYVGDQLRRAAGGHVTQGRLVSAQSPER